MDEKLAIELTNKLEITRQHRLNDKQKSEISQIIKKYDLKDLRLISDIANSLLSENIYGREKGNEITPRQLIEGDVITREIEPQIKQIRMDFFGSVEAPFFSYDDVKKWITQSQISEVDAIIRGRTIENGQLTICVFNDVSCFGDAPPGILQHRVGEFADSIGADPESLFYHVLTNAKPIFPKIKVISRTQTDLQGHVGQLYSLEISFRSAPNMNDMRRIQKMIKTEMKVLTVKELTGWHVEFYYMVTKKGIPSGNGKKKFWEDITSEWNRTHNKNQFSSWKIANIYYNRIISGTSPNKTNELQKDDIKALNEELLRKYKGNLE
jgi:hypothetical protein